MGMCVHALNVSKHAGKKRLDLSVSQVTKGEVEGFLFAPEAPTVNANTC